ncbi:MULTISPECIES: condensation domain-containing protein, partial [unclassified Bradyrhizobium]|uniref:condensation domain-containing protein n=1 Tax=unclassified Bradyrhizobium TaxID=2631580 RepID=UPI002916F3F6
MTFAQEGIWLHEEQSRNSSAYSIFNVVRIIGEFDVAVFERSLSEVIVRHEILRTNFRLINGEPTQIIRSPAPIRVAVHDISDLVTTKKEEVFRSLADVEAKRRFDLENELLFRVTVLRSESDRHVLLVNVHHLVCDGWSLGLLTAEIMTIYEEMANGRPTSVAELPIQYGDYAAWQRSNIADEVMLREIPYWKAKLKGASPLLGLPTDRPRPSVRSFSGSRVEFRVDPKQVNELRGFCRRHRVSVFVAMLAAFASVLHRHTGNESILVGSPIANRPVREVRHLVGLFIDLVPFRIDFFDDPTGVDLLERVRSTTLEVLDHQLPSFERLVTGLGISRDPSHSPLFQVVFAMQPADILPAVEGLQLEVSPVGSDGAKFDLTVFTVEERDGGMLCIFEYATDLFEAATIERLSGHFGMLLEGIVAAPDARIGELALLSEAERERLVVEWNATRADYPAEKCLHEL